MGENSLTWIGPGGTPFADWSDPRNWIDLDGNYGIPAVEDYVKLGDSAAEAEPSDTTSESINPEDEATLTSD
jgi:hypothetical protein